MEYMYQYLLFLAKTATFVMGIVFVISMIAALIMRQKNTEGQLKIQSLNEDNNENVDFIQQEILEKKEYKKLAKARKKEDVSERPKCFVMHFKGDMEASEVTSLKVVVDMVCQIAKPEDTFALVLSSTGGYVPHYGLAASELIRARNCTNLVVLIDKFAASGGYLMACPAHQIYAAPFAVIGSIGVIGQVPNIHHLLKKHDVEIEQHTSGKYKRTLTLLGENTDDGRTKFKEELHVTHDLFKEQIAEFRPTLNMDVVATGETWYGKKAVELGLIDGLCTSNEFILRALSTHQVYELDYEINTSLKEKVSALLKAALVKVGLVQVQS